MERKILAPHNQQVTKELKNNLQISNMIKSGRYDPYLKKNKISKENNIETSNVTNKSLFTNISKCFSETMIVPSFSKSNNIESQDIFCDEMNIDINDDELRKVFQSTPITLKSRSKTCDDKFPLTINKEFKNNIMEKKCTGNISISDKCITRKHIDPFNDSLNMSYNNLKQIYINNLENKILNENSKINHLSEVNKSSQYKNEVLDTFNCCETTICHINEDIFKVDKIIKSEMTDNNIKENNSIYDEIIADNPDFSNSFDPILPTNLTQLLVNKIENENEKKDDSVSNHTLYSDKKRTPLLPIHYKEGFYGLPVLAKSLIQQYKGIEKLYDWQNECLTLPAIVNRQNLIYALPTSGGKTLVAEILMLREVVCRKKSVLFILPFVSIVQEKVWGLSPFGVGLDFLIEEYAAAKGTFPPRKRKKRKSIFIATLEKGLSLIRSLLENNRLNEIGLIVVDELHLIGEPTRGCILEMLLINVMYSGEDIQIIGMSATIGNIDELAKFLNAEVYTKDFRPVDLKEYVKINESIYEINWKNSNITEKIVLNRKINFGYSPQVEKIDPDHLGGLVMEVIPKGSCLIFCPTKKNCENVAILLCKVIFKQLLEYRAEEKELLIKAIKAESGGEESLISLIPWGVAYHHSGLAVEERKLIEDAFRSGVLSVLCCTSTLAAGVNLPAQRVILRAPLIGKNFISLSQYKQMVGRAGRAGFEGHGDSILICHSYFTEKVKELIDSPMDKASSSLHSNDGANLRSLILGAIALEIANSRKALRSLINFSLMAIQAERLNIDIKQWLDKTLEVLFKMGAIHTKITEKDGINIIENISTTPNTHQNLKRMSSNKSSSLNKHITVQNETELVVSRLGKAAIKGSIELQRAHMLYGDLRIAQNDLVVIGVLHLLYLVTPYDFVESIKPDMCNYYNIYSNMNMEAIQTAKVIGLVESVAIQMAKGKLPKSVSERVLNRFYVTLILHDLWNQKSLMEVSEKYQINKGTIQNLMTGTATFASSVLRFCVELEEFWAFKELLNGFNERLSHFCSLELVPLMQLPSVKKSRAIQLYKAGYKTIQDVAQAKPIDLIESIDHVSRNIANQLIAAAKLLLLEKVENLREEAEDVMKGLDVRIDN